MEKISHLQLRLLAQQQIPRSNNRIELRTKEKDIDVPYIKLVRLEVVTTEIPDICQFLVHKHIFRPVKSTPRVRKFATENCLATKQLVT